MCSFNGFGSTEITQHEHNSIHTLLHSSMHTRRRACKGEQVTAARFFLSKCRNKIIRPFCPPSPEIVVIRYVPGSKVLIESSMFLARFSYDYYTLCTIRYVYHTVRYVFHTKHFLYITVRFSHDMIRFLFDTKVARFSYAF